MDTMYTVLVTDLCVLGYSVQKRMSVFTLIGSLTFPVVFPRIVCAANVHIMLSLVGTSVQVTLVWLVVVGQLPQFDARML